MKVMLPPNEAARPEALRQYRILEAARERAFDDLAFLGAQPAKAPLAGVGLTDAHRSGGEFVHLESARHRLHWGRSEP